MNSNYMAGKQFEYEYQNWFKPIKLDFVNLYQVGELCCEQGFQVEPHLQVCNEISYIISGHGTFTTDGVDTDVAEGDIYINKKGGIHTIRADKGVPLRYYYFAFELNEEADARILGPIKSIFGTIKSPAVKDTTDIMAPFSKIMDELYSVTDFSRVMLECYSKQILVLTCRAFQKSSELTRMPVNSIRNKGFPVYSVIRYVEKNLYDVRYIKNISKCLGYSHSYLSHLFKEKMGMTLQSYINLRKIEKAMELIKSGHMSITQIALKLNYDEVQSFSKSFKRLAGVSPLEYKKRCTVSNGSSYSRTELT